LQKEQVLGSATRVGVVTIPGLGGGETPSENIDPAVRRGKIGLKFPAFGSGNGRAAARVEMPT
jgi:hypothetical protein